MRVEIYNTLNDWIEANNLAHDTCKNLDGYNSVMYSSNPILTIDDKFMLPELEQFSNELKVVGFNFVELDLSLIKQQDI